LRCCWIILCWLCLLPSLAQAGPVVDLNEHTQFRYDLVPALQMVDAAVDTDDPSVAWAAVAAGQTQSLPGGSPSLGFVHEMRWFHVRVRNVEHAAQRWLLVVEQPRIDQINVQIKDRSGRIQHAELGDLRPFAARSVAHRFPNVELLIARGDEVEILIGVRSTSSVQLPLRLYTPTALWAASHDEQAALGLYYGILLALFLYNLAVLVSIRDASYAYYLAYLGAFGLFMLSFNGVGFQYLWPQSPTWASASLPVSLGAILVTSLSFARSFLDLRKRVPMVARAFDWVIPGFALLTLGAFTPWQLQVTQWLNAGLIVFGVVVTVSAVLSGRTGYRPAWYFLLAWGLLITGGVALPLSSFGLLPRSALTEFGLQIGSALEMLLLSFSLAYRIHLLRADNARIEFEARETLEQRVSERTQALKLTAEQLATANAQLEDVNRRDGLTGLFNRRYLDEAMGLQWQAASTSGRSLAVLMVDIDHFKLINDRFGHGAGDDCLRALGRVLEGCFPEYDCVVARYGGEEFSIVLPGHNIAAAIARAENLRSAVAARPFETEAGAVEVTISIGVASIEPPAHAGSADLRKRSDAALYAAKRGGRNRVMSG